FCHCGEVKSQPLISGFIVIWSYNEQSISTVIDSPCRICNTFFGGVAAGSCNNGYSSAYSLDCPFNHYGIFLLCQSRCFTCGSANHKSVGPLFKMPVYQPVECLQVQITVALKWRGNSDYRAAKSVNSHNLSNYLDKDIEKSILRKAYSRITEKKPTLFITPQHYNPIASQCQGLSYTRIIPDSDRPYLASAKYLPLP